MRGSKRTAYLSLCDECGLHGHIVCANGEKSREFGTIFKGLEVLRAMLLEEKVARKEGSAIMRQLVRSEMIPRDADEDRYLEQLLEMRGGTEEGFRELFEEVHHVMRSKSVGDKKEYFQ